MKISTLLILFLTLIMTFNSFGQDNKYKSGYIVLTSGETLEGEIKNVLPIALSESVYFRKKGEGTPIQYFPNQLSKFYFEDSNYYEVDSIPFQTTTNKF